MALILQDLERGDAGSRDARRALEPSGFLLPQVPADPAADDVLEAFGPYNLLEKGAGGGRADRYTARQRGGREFGKVVAIKRILPQLSTNDEFVRMFIDEAKLAAQLDHPNIVRIFDLGQAAGFYYIAMEFVDGRDLRNLLRKVREYRTPMPEVLAASVIMKVASALDYAHRKRAGDGEELLLVHRDISPQNLLISYDGAVKLVDFGIAKVATMQTQAGALKGKLFYMSPEQALGQPLDGRSDLYSLGLVLAELVTGERCFQADSELGVLEKVRLGQVRDVRASHPGISPELERILKRALQKDVEKRYASAHLMEGDLKAMLGREGREPTERDLAEYVTTLLKGTAEELAALIASRYPPRAEPGQGPLPGQAPGRWRYSGAPHS
jgi:serine/threonine protein kinase